MWVMPRAIPLLFIFTSLCLQRPNQSEPNQFRINSFLLYIRWNPLEWEMKNKGKLIRTIRIKDKGQVDHKTFSSSQTVCIVCVVSIACMIQSTSGTDIVKLTSNEQIKFLPAQWVSCKKPEGENPWQSVRWSEFLEYSWDRKEQDGVPLGSDGALPKLPTHLLACQTCLV